MIMCIGMNPTTQTEREEALLLLASLRSGGEFLMTPEPRHVQALLELLEEDSNPISDLPEERCGFPLTDREHGYASAVTVRAASPAGA